MTVAAVVSRIAPTPLIALLRALEAAGRLPEDDDASA
jgi:hypothetical protein